MNVKESSKKEIEMKIASMGDYVKMGYLSECLKKNLDFDTKKFVLMTLSTLYENRKMYREAGKCLRMSAEINTTQKNKIEEFVKSIELFAKGGHFGEVDFSLKKAIGIANENERKELSRKVVALLKAEARNAIKSDKRKYASEVYEQLLSMEIAEVDKIEVKRELMPIYERLGKLKDYYDLKRQLG